MQMIIGSTALRGIRSLSMGAKLLLILMLSLFMSIGALFINSTVEERQGRSNQVVQDISRTVGGPETFLGPTLLVPYTQSSDNPKTPVLHGVYVIFPETAKANVKTKTEERRRSLFRVPVFQSQAQLDATFSIPTTLAAAPADAQMDWDRAELVIGVSDSRGALSDATLTTSEGNTTLTPATVATTLNAGAESGTFTLFGTRASTTMRPGANFTVSASLHFSGAQRIAVSPYGKSTQIDIAGDWPNPGFDGGFLPTTREVTPQGFHAAWNIPFIARGVRAEGDAATIVGLDKSIIGVSFVEVADPYQSVTRSLKYAPLFLGLVFLTYFLFEVTTGKRLHVAQYLLVGLAQLIFYLLLLSFAERIGFGYGFLLGGGATVALLTTNVAWVFHSRMQTARSGAVFSALYGMIYLLLRLEDNALLIGALGSFAAVSVAMYFTRSMNWSAPTAADESTTSPTAPHFGAFRVGEL